MSIILIGVACLERVYVMHEHQRESILALCQLRHKGPDALRGDIIGY